MTHDYSNCHDALIKDGIPICRMNLIPCGRVANKDCLMEEEYKEMFAELKKSLRAMMDAREGEGAGTP